MAVSRKKKIIIIVAAVAVLAIIVVISIFARGNDQPEVTVVKVEVRPELKSTVTASGEVRPIKYINLTSEVPGRIEEISVNPGDQVTKGQALVRVDPTQLESTAAAQAASVQASISDTQSARESLLDAEDRVAQAQVALRTARAQLQSANIGIEEAKARVNQQRVSVRDAQIGVQSARTGVSTSESRANQQQALLRGSASQRSKATTYSPLTGVVADIPARVGTFAVAGLSTTSLMTIADMSTVNVEVNVDETEITSVELGHPVKVKVDAMNEREVDGVVVQKNPLAVGKSDTSGGGISNRVNVQEAKEFKVIIELKNLPDDLRNSLRPGMTATATITTKVKQNVVAVPLQAIVEKAPSPTPTPAAGQAPPAPTEKPKDIKGVYVLDGNKVKFVPVETGITGESDIEIVSGLPQNVEVITGPSRVLRTLKEGTVVKKQERKPGASPEEG